MTFLVKNRYCVSKGLEGHTRLIALARLDVREGWLGRLVIKKLGGPISNYSDSSSLERQPAPAFV